MEDDEMDSRTDALFQTRKGSKDLFDRAVGLLPGGVSHGNRSTTPFPIYIERADGPRAWDVDGNEYIDYSMGSASLLLGHASPTVVKAIQDQAAKGTFFSNCHPLEVQWAALIQQLVPSAERVRFVGSGTEATMLAVRIARAFTGRTKIVRFEGHYHGWHDHLATGMDLPFYEAPSLGLVPGSVEATVVLPANDPARVEQVLRSDPDIAAVILEASGASWGTVPLVPGFHAELRRLTTQYGVVLVFDEIITGFRYGPGGVQARIGVTPDVTTLAKVVTGGLPGGAVVGRAEIMRVLDPREDFRGKRPGAIHRGTFNANPLVAAAGIATLTEVATGAPQRHADVMAARLRDDMRQVLRRHAVAGTVYGDSSTFHIYIGKPSIEGLDAAQLKGIPKPVVSGLQQALRARGVDILSYTGGVTSSTHTDREVDETVAIFDDAVKDLVERNVLPRI
jgi:glutamate-1-semialdehyde 2,1-aminomutase